MRPHPNAAFEAFKEPEAYYATLGHETTHRKKGPGRLDRDVGRKCWSDESYAMESLVAELSAAFLCSDLGLFPAPRAGHAAYLDTWLKMLKADKRAIFSAAAHAQRAADYLQELQPQEKEMAAPAANFPPTHPTRLAIAACDRRYLYFFSIFDRIFPDRGFERHDDFPEISPVDHELLALFLATPSLCPSCRSYAILDIAALRKRNSLPRFPARPRANVHIRFSQTRRFRESDSERLKHCSGDECSTPGLTE